MNALARIVGTVAGCTPFIAAVGLDRTGGWGAGTGMWGLLVLILIWSNVSPKDDDEGEA